MNKKEKILCVAAGVILGGASIFSLLSDSKEIRKGKERCEWLKKECTSIEKGLRERNEKIYRSLIQ